MRHRAADGRNDRRQIPQTGCVKPRFVNRGSQSFGGSGCGAGVNATHRLSPADEVAEIRAEFARLIQPLIERDHYGMKNVQNVSAPNILSVQRVGDKQDTVVLTFDQPVVWRDDLVAEFSFEVSPEFAAQPLAVKVVGGSVQGSTLTLRLSGSLPNSGSALSYLDSKSWSQDRLVMGANGLPALTFRSVPIR